MVRPPVTGPVGAVDIGTNSMRLLIAHSRGEVVRLDRVTGLGRGVDRSGSLSAEAIEETLPVLQHYGRLMASHGVVARQAIATSASRDAGNREEFFDLAEEALGVRPALITGEEEAGLAYSGATGWYQGPGPVLVSDIGGGSTEFVTAGRAVSIDIGSVRLTERALPDRPASPDQLASARAMLREVFDGLDFGQVGSLIGVAGTWTELPAMARGLASGTDTHAMTVGREEVTGVAEMLAGLTVEQTRELGTLNPARAPVILGGTLVAEAVMRVVGVDEAVVSVRDTLDGVVTRLLAG